MRKAWHWYVKHDEIILGTIVVLMALFFVSYKAYEKHKVDTWVEQNVKRTEAFMKDHPNLI